MKVMTRAFLILFSAAFITSCTQRTYLTAEPLVDGGYLTRASASTWREAKGTAVARAKEDATSFCQHEGRGVTIKETKTTLDLNFGIEKAELEFDCVATPSRAPH